MSTKKGFNKEKFEADHFVFKRGSSEKYFNGWEDVRYEGGLAPYAVNKCELEKGNVEPQLYNFLCHVYGEDAMAKYFPKPDLKQERKATLHFSQSSIMANGVSKQTANRQNNDAKPMTDAEIDELAALLCGMRW